MWMKDKQVYKGFPLKKKLMFYVLRLASLHDDVENIFSQT